MLPGCVLLSAEHPVVLPGCGAASSCTSSMNCLSMLLPGAEQLCLLPGHAAVSLLSSSLHGSPPSSKVVPATCAASCSVGGCCWTGLLPPQHSWHSCYPDCCRRFKARSDGHEPTAVFAHAASLRGRSQTARTEVLRPTASASGAPEWTRVGLHALCCSQHAPSQSMPLCSGDTVCASIGLAWFDVSPGRCFTARMRGPQSLSGACRTTATAEGLNSVLHRVVRRSVRGNQQL